MYSESRQCILNLDNDLDSKETMEKVLWATVSILGNSALHFLVAVVLSLLLNTYFSPIISRVTEGTSVIIFN